MIMIMIIYAKDILNSKYMVSFNNVKLFIY